MLAEALRYLSADPWALAVNAPYAIAFVAVAAEVTWRAIRAGTRRPRLLCEAASATGMAAGAMLVGVAYTAVLTAAWYTVGRHSPAAATDFWAAHPVLGAAATFVAWDFSGWLYHAIGHRTRVGWAAHQAHHSGPGYDMTLGLRQSWTPFHGLVHHPLLALAGFDLRVVFVCAAVSNCWQVLEHTSLPVRFPRWVEAVIMTPATHRHHHGTDGGVVNLGPIFTVWDRLTGTWRSAGDPAPTSYGPTTPASLNPLVVETAGWAALVRPRLPAPKR